MQKRLEQVVGLAKRLALHRAQSLRALRQGGELALEGKRGQGNCETTHIFLIDARLV